MRGRQFLVVIGFLLSGCSGSNPISSLPQALPAAPLPELIEIISASAPPGSTISLVDCSDNWDAYFCFKDLHLTFSARSNRNSDLRTLHIESLTSDGKVCGDSLEDANQPLVAGVVAVFRATVVYLKPDCFDLMPFRATHVLTRILDTPNPRVNAGVPRVPIEFMKQEFPISYTFTREAHSP